MRIDWHIHTVLSPCASLDMSPARIIHEALGKNLDAIGICDHNSTRQVRQMMTEGLDEPIKILPGVELSSKEEIHCLAFFDDLKALDEMQFFIDRHIRDIKNKPEAIGDQVVVDWNDRIIYVEEKMLILGLLASIDDILCAINSLGGLAVPAHVNKQSNSLISQLGFIPADMDIVAVEVVGSGDPRLQAYPWITSSDAHYPQDVGSNCSHVTITDWSLDSLRKYFNQCTPGEFVK